MPSSADRILHGILARNPDIRVDDSTAGDLMATVSRRVNGSPEPAKNATASEHEEQQTLFDEAAWRANQDPDWGMLFPIPNGQYRPGERPEAGLSAGKGYPDVGLDVARGGYHGLRIEMKVPGNYPTFEQWWWIAKLRAQGYRVEVCYSANDAIELIESYLEGDDA